MDGFEKVARFDEITSAYPKRVKLESIEIVLFRKDEEIYAIENLCPHQLLSAFHQSTLDEYSLTCPMHGWSFNIRNGNAIAGSGRIKTVEVRVIGNDVYVKKPEQEKKYSRF